MGMVDYVRMKTRERLLRGEHVNWIENSSRRMYIRQVVLSAPPWVDRAALRELQAQARHKTRVTGEQHVLAHIVPLSHPLVCGLTVPWNLRVEHWRKNLQDGNKPLYAQRELFDGPEQLRLL